MASFDPLPNRVLLWTSTAPGTELRWEIATDEAMADTVSRGEATADRDSGTVCVDATGLAPATTHWFRFHTETASSPIGRTRTLPVAGGARLRVGVTCCARFGESHFEVYRRLAETELDLVVHLGDYIYEDVKCQIDERRPEPDHPCVTLEDYRTRHAQARRDPDLAALHARHPMVVVCDDHDLADNAWRDGAKAHDPEEQGPWAARKQAALQAHQEHLPKRLADPDDLTSGWRRLDAGPLVTIIATETRAHRDEPAGAEGTLDADDPRRTMLGPTQARWLEETLADAPGWALLLSGTVVSQLTIDAPDALDGVLPEKYAVVDGRGVNTDQWDGYLQSQRDLAAALGRRRTGSVIVSGDIHSAWAIEGPLGADGAAVAVELVCPPAATTPIGGLLPPGVGARLGPALADQIAPARWVDVDHHGFLVLDIGAEQIEAAWHWVDPEAGAERPPADAPEGPARRWVIPAGAGGTLVDPEADAVGPSERTASAPPSPLHDLRRARRRRVAAAVALAAAAAVALGRRRAAGR